MNFWANKLAGAEVAPEPQLPRGLFYNTPAPLPQPTVPQMQTYTPSVRLIQGSTCPGCGSNNYRGNVGSYAISCSECGYHPRFEQTGYGTRSLASDTGTATPARQVAGSQTMRGAIALLNAGAGEHI